MLPEDRFRLWCHTMAVSPQALVLLQQIRTTGPARAVRSAAGNVSGRYPSRKMGVTIQFESHRNELAAIYEFEHDAQILEYYDQPPAIRLAYPSRSGRQLSVWHTPDFFVLREDAAGWEECKTEEQLLALAEKSPARYVYDPPRGWHCPPGESYAAQFGFYYHLRSSHVINWTYQWNREFLDDYWRADPALIRQATRQSVHALVVRQPGISLHDLCRALAPSARPDDVYTMIAHHELYVDLDTQRLVEPQHVNVFLDRDSAGAALRDQAPTRSLPVPVATGTCQHPAALQRYMAADQSAAAEANRRYRVVRAYLARETLPEPAPPARTLRRWVAHYKAADQAFGNGYVGLLPRPKPGNQRRKLPQETLQLLEAFIAQHYETPRQPRTFAVYAAFLLHCQQHGIVPASYKTFCTLVRQRSRYTQVLKRQGARAAYQHQPFHWELTQTTPRHGSHPFHIAHLDHTELDVALLCSVTGRPLGRPWATFLTDAYSRCILAVHLTFDPPSYRSCMMVIRECVRRHGRLPHIVVVDGGREFRSTYFETLLARYECVKKTRPAAAPRFGSVCERLFGTANTELIHNLAGNTQLMRHVRQVTKARQPQRLAIWTLGTLHQYVCTWAYEVYETLPHPALGTSPRDAFSTGGTPGSNRRHQRPIAYDQDFVMYTLPTTVKGTAKVSPGRGVKLHHIFYWSEAFRHPDVEGTSLPIRYDPYDVSVVYTYVYRTWVPCYAEYYASFRGRSERELQIATEEIRKRRQQSTAQRTVSAVSLARFLESVAAEEVLLRQRLADQEMRRVVQPLVAQSARGYGGDERGVERSPSLPLQVLQDEEPGTEQVTGSRRAARAPFELYAEFA